MMFQFLCSFHHLLDMAQVGIIIHDHIEFVFDIFNLLIVVDECTYQSCFYSRSIIDSS
jgi:hypothetical protein